MAVRDGRVCAEAVVGAALEKIEAHDGVIHAFLEVFAEQALARAREIDARRNASRPLGLLAGVPVAVKDNICFEQGKTTCASRLLESYCSPYTATALEKIIEAGAIVIGKTNLDEFAMGSSTEHSSFGQTRNPWDHARVPGGSSGGSAAAVAAQMVPLALGSDTGGSIRQPASFCGVVGLKPTYGRVSRYGLVAHASSLDQIGPLAKTVQDCSLCLGVLAGYDPLDSTSSKRPVEDFGRTLAATQQKQDQIPPNSLRVLGVPKQWQSGSTDTQAWAALERITKALTKQGIEIREIDLPHAAHAVAAYYIIATAEASSNLARYDGVRYGTRARLMPNDTLETLYTKSRSQGFGPEVQRRIMLGTFVLSSGYYDAYYLNALKVRRLIQQDYDLAFAAGCDAILMPATTGPAFLLGEKTTDPMALYLEDVYTVGVNLAGLPAITVPAGVVVCGQSTLPIGVQLVGRAWCERELLMAATVVESLVEAFECQNI